MKTPRRRQARTAQRQGFTLVELLVVMMVIVVLASTVLFAMYGALNDARESRTRTQVAKLHDLVMTRWDSYLARPIRVIDNSTGLSLPVQVRRNSRVMKQARLNALRDLMRMEMPDRKTDVTDAPAVNTYSYRDEAGQIQTVAVRIARPSVSQYYLRQSVATSTWTEQFQDAECLYMIVSSMRDLTSNGTDFLKESEIGDKDGDGMPEIWDGWRQPIAFLRWPAGFVEHPGADGTYGTADDIAAYGNLQVEDPVATPDPFDPLKVDRRPDDSTTSSIGVTYKFNFATYPLIFSGGPDEVWDIVRYDYSDSAPDVIIPYHYNRVPNQFNNNWPQNDPYAIMPNSSRRLGEPFLASYGYVDNITNHALGGE